MKEIDRRKPSRGLISVLAVISGHCLRCLFRLALAILGFLALAGSADASGCHISERPTFGMEYGEASHDRSQGLAFDRLAPDSFHYRHAPCPGEPAGFPSKFKLPNAYASTSNLLDHVMIVEARWIEARELRPPPADPTPLERPPRGLLTSRSRPSGMLATS